ncbi:MAG: dihydrofolate reductase, partial [Rubrivivax sp.]
LYAAALPIADELELTEVDRQFPDAETHFPAFDRSGFKVVRREAHSSADGTAFAFVTYRKTA